jgi:signal transduction histidine kinase
MLISGEPLNTVHRDKRIIPRRSTARFTGKSLVNYRRIFNQILSLAGEGRMTLAVLKDIVRILLRFFGCSAVEIVFQENQKTLHAKSVNLKPPAISGWKEKRAGEAIIFDAIETVPSALVDHLKSRYRDQKKKRGVGQQFVFTFPDGGQSKKSGSGHETGRHIFLLIPANKSVAGVLVMSLPRAGISDRISRDFLNRLASIIGLSLSHNLSRFELRERVKELTCMYNIANLAVSSEQSVEQFLQQVAELLPAAYLYPEITEARIVFDEKSYQTAGFGPGRQCQSADVLVKDIRRGAVEVIYRENRPALDEGPFLAEERRLLDSVAGEIALIIERKEAEIEQAKLHEQLRHADRLATIGKLAAGIAHELNEPLTGILGFAELLKESAGMPGQSLSDIVRIEAAALHAREVVRKLLLFARQISPRQDKVGVNRVIQEVVSFLEGRCLQQNIKTQTKLYETLPDICADESQVRQIIMNLMINAVQAMQKGGILTIGTHPGEKEIVISIRDNGPGIPDDIKDKIFLPFFTTKDVHAGTGLGLSVVHGIVKSHRGRIKVFSQLGKGTVFKVYLPVPRA